METLETLKEKFSQIGYTIKGHDINTFLFDHNGKNTGFRVFNSRMEKEIGDSNPHKTIGVVLYFDRIKVEVMDKNCISITDSNAPENSGFFIHFYNFDNGK